MKQTYEVTIKVTVEPFESVDFNYYPTPNDVEEMVMEAIRSSAKQLNPRFNMGFKDWGVLSVTKRFRGL